MTEELESCPRCYKGYLRPTGQSSLAGENKEPFTDTGSMRILVCDKCGMKRASAGINEHRSISDSVKATAIDHTYGQTYRTS